MTPHSYLFIVIFLGVALLFPIMPLILAWMWRRFFQPPRPGAEKNATYECGVESIGEAQIQFRSQYYLYAIIFLIFDVEAVFHGAVCRRLSRACQSVRSSRSWFSCCCF
jgi:NADH-quinone oxidoreductase subunit A